MNIFQIPLRNSKRQQAVKLHGHIMISCCQIVLSFSTNWMIKVFLIVLFYVVAMTDTMAMTNGWVVYKSCIVVRFVADRDELILCLLLSITARANTTCNGPATLTGYWITTPNCNKIQNEQMEK